jgi:hypothetical protein
MGFVVGKVTLGQGYFRVLIFFPVSIIPPALQNLISFTNHQRNITLATEGVVK